MKKKFIVAALLAGVMAASCFTGCIGNGGGDGENGEQGQQGSVEKGVAVTAEEWVSAVNASWNSQNFTMCNPSNGTVTVTGNYQGNDKVPVNIIYRCDDDGLNVNIDSDSNNPVYFTYASVTVSVSGFADIYSHQEDYTEDWLKSLKDCIYKYGIYIYDDKEISDGSDTYYIKTGEKYYDASKLSVNSEEAEWSVWETDFSGATLCDIPGFPIEFATEENGEEKDLAELYEAFTYTDGVYTAELWIYNTQCPVSVSFKDGYILGFEMKYTKTEVEEIDGLTVTDTFEATVKIYDIGKTSITPDPDAVKAVEDYIKENS